jgi:uncharacterized protein YaaR (DUF327 family)
MKITDKNNIRDLHKGTKNQPEKSTNGGIFSLFSTKLKTQQVAIANYDNDMDQLRSELDSIGQTLEQEPTIQNFKKFREQLSKLVKQVSNEAYRLEKVGGTPTNPRYYEIITVIDKEADKLYELLVKEQKDRMAITASVIGIKGLVVDLIT